MYKSSCACGMVVVCVGGRYSDDDRVEQQFVGEMDWNSARMVPYFILYRSFCTLPCGLNIGTALCTMRMVPA